ncbi:HNH endonuclease signature motif containing protein [uncultured Roseovarius sp.]|uniref:HNH endonuclease n=1 Tax=uncultured Roseovarius sp. TaxID=293344 RepID=UPI0025F3DA2F|nr:HNH endonuclease signature motif containing protein [uncultured Roseovarius sp.]
MNRFFLKIHGNDTHCPGGFGGSRNKSDWEGSTIILPKRGPVLARKEDNKTDQTLKAGDELWIWTHESSGGRGLTAKAIAGEVPDSEASKFVVLHNVEIAPRPFDYRGFPEAPVNGRVTGSRFLDYASTQRPSAVYLIEDVDYPDFLSVVQERGWAGNKIPAPSPHWEEEVQNHKDDLLAGLEDRKAAMLKARSGQGQFRRDLIKRYNGKCVVTKCAIREALEAAHVMPHTGDPKWDHADNGVLLRRDLHALFDDMLWSIDPASNTLRIADRLKTSGYRKLDGRQIDHQIAPALLFVHFEKFQNGGAND